MLPSKEEMGGEEAELPSAAMSGARLVYQLPPERSFVSSSPASSAVYRHLAFEVPCLEPKLRKGSPNQFAISKRKEKKKKEG